jgi:predicted transcriptional regulator
MSLIFDHSKDTLSAAMNMPEDSMEKLSEKMTDITKQFITSDDMTRSHVAEKIALELSYSELVFVATGQIFSVLEKATEKKKEIFSLLEILAKNMGKDE